MTTKERLKEYISFKNISVNKFEKTCKLSTGYVNNMRVSIQPDKIKNIALNFPDLNTGWLLTGEGEMLKNNSDSLGLPDDSTSGKLIPFYDVEAAAGSEYGMDMTETTKHSSMIEIGSILKDSELAIRVYGNSMIPNYPAGCVIGLRRYNESFIDPGHVYVLETRENRFLKRLYYNKERTAIRCVSDNTMIHTDGTMKGEFIYQDFEIPFEDVNKLYRVVGVIKRNIM